jgi:hypothetical protein
MFLGIRYEVQKSPYLGPLPSFCPSACPLTFFDLVPTVIRRFVGLSLNLVKDFFLGGEGAESCRICLSFSNSRLCPCSAERRDDLGP